MEEGGRRKEEQGAREINESLREKLVKEDRKEEERMKKEMGRTKEERKGIGGETKRGE